LASTTTGVSRVCLMTWIMTFQGNPPSAPPIFFAQSLILFYPGLEHVPSSCLCRSSSDRCSHPVHTYQAII
jgi:hypothetical protein